MLLLGLNYGRGGNLKLKKCFVICWYGPWPVYFQLYLNSCSYNKEWNWIIFTDTNI